MKQQDLLASTQMISFSPIISEPQDVQMQYYTYLRKLVRLVKWDHRKFAKAQLQFYKQKLCATNEPPKTTQFDFNCRFCYLLPFDLTMICCFSQKITKTEKLEILIKQIVGDFLLPDESRGFLASLFRAAQGENDAWDKVLCSELIGEFQDYLELFRKNLTFMKEKPYPILITATMSAGKSTLINALVGKSISRMQNMACTSKIHTIIAKLFEDDVISENDYNLSLDASQAELFKDNDDNKTVKITAATYFDGALSGHRIILLDSPGVNSSENTSHADISYQPIRTRKYKLILYVLNATQLSTNDENRHLAMIKKHLGRSKIIFVLNKVDRFMSEDDNLAASLESQKKFLISHGFHDPIICPVSSRAAYLVKKSRHSELSRIEQGDLENYIDKFEEQSLSSYYESHLQCAPIPTTDEKDMLLANCGFSYLEKIIENIHNGG